MDCYYCLKVIFAAKYISAMVFGGSDLGGMYKILGNPYLNSTTILIGALIIVKISFGLPHAQIWMLLIQFYFSLPSSVCDYMGNTLMWIANHKLFTSIMLLKVSSVTVTLLSIFKLFQSIINFGENEYLHKSSNCVNLRGLLARVYDTEVSWGKQLFGSTSNFLPWIISV